MAPRASRILNKCEHFRHRSNVREHGKTLAFGLLFALRCSLFARINRLSLFGCSSAKLRVPVEQRLAFRLVQLKMLPRLLDVGTLEVIDRELHLVLQPYLAVRHRPPVGPTTHVMS